MTLSWRSISALFVLLSISWFAVPRVMPKRLKGLQIFPYHDTKFNYLYTDLEGDDKVDQVVYYNESQSITDEIVEPENFQRRRDGLIQEYLETLKPSKGKMWAEPPTQTPEDITQIVQTTFTVAFGGNLCNKHPNAKTTGCVHLHIRGSETANHIQKEYEDRTKK